jgi:hypothetical protein
MDIANQASTEESFAFNSSVLDQGLPKGGHYSRSTTALILWTLRVNTRSKGGAGCVYVVWERGGCAGARGRRGRVHASD